MSVQALRKGAKDFLVKDKNGYYLQRLPFVIERILKEEDRYRETLMTKRNTEAVLATISDGIVCFNLAGIITFANQAAAIYLHTPYESLIGKSLEESIHFLDGFVDGHHRAILEVKTSNQSTVVGEYYFTLEDEMFLGRANLTPVLNDLMHLEGYILIFQDISEMKHTHNRSHPIVTQDELTGLLNRKAFLQRLDHTILVCGRYTKRCAVLYLNIDGFTAINEILGHTLGDKLLIQVGKRIQSVVRDSDVVARVGADEFSIMLPHINHNHDAGTVARKINQALLRAFELNGHQYYISASIGIALYPLDSNAAEKIMQYAYFAMSWVKKRGKNNYQYYKADLNDQAEKTMKLTHDLRLAITADQFELYFQPQIATDTKRLIGCEALLRWHHPELGMISPAVFIPIAEEIGFIGSIGRWVLAKACESYLIWEKQGLADFTIGINVSIKELTREQFIEDTAECIYQYAVDPKRFQFEITESIFAHDIEDITHKLHQLKNIGFQIAMDDFGTGYSCLSYLKNLPIDIIKIDRSFVQSLDSEWEDRQQAIVATIIDLAKRLKITTLAEGVETQEHATLLESLGCDQMQGFYFAKPMCLKHVSEFICQQTGKIAQG